MSLRVHILTKAIKMKKITLFTLCLCFSIIGLAQVIDQPANWPNANWTVTGTFTADGLVNDPTVDSAFTFDDDGAGSSSLDDSIEAESPIIDLTAAQAANETQIAITGEYMHRDIGGSLEVQWWDADSSTWNTLLSLNGTTSPNSYLSCDNMFPFETGFDISGFTATQLSGFKYRLAYDDGNGWQWGWCIQNPTISSAMVTPPNCDAVVTSPTDGEVGVDVDPVINWSAATGFPDGYLVSIGTTDGGTDVVDNVDVGNALTYSPATLNFLTEYFVTITPYNAGGNAAGCTSSSFTTEADTTIPIDCAGSPVNLVYCYENNDTTFWLFVSNDGSPLRITFAAGTIEGFFDDITIYDGSDNTSTQLFNNNDDGQNNLAGLDISSTGDTLYMEVDSDFSVSCSSGSQTAWDFTVACATCVNPEVTFDIADDCDNGEQFFVEVDITDIGSATSLDVSDDQGSAVQTVAAAGLLTFGPYANGTDVVITVANNDDGNCVVQSNVLNLPACPPTNDLCEDAIEVVCGDSVSGNTDLATGNGAPTDFCGTGPGAPGVWYTIIGSEEIVELSLCGSDYDTKLQVWTGDCGAFTCVAGNDDDFGECGGLQSFVEFISEPGTEYYIYVFGFGSSTGNFTLNVNCVDIPDPPVNDECVDAISFLANEGGDCVEFTSGTIFGATASAEANACGGTSDDDVWFSFEAVSENHAITLFNIVGDTQDLYHVLYEGDDCNNLTQVYCSDPNDSVANGLTVGNTYYVRVYSWTGTPLQDVAFDICVFTIPPPITTSTTEFTVEELVQDVLIDSECNLVSNISWSTGTDFGSTNGIGYFEANGSSWPFESGVILTSGDVNNAAGPEDETISDGTFAWPGDADLENAIPGLNLGDTNNASIIEFDFVPVVDQISFDFIFAAEEYGTFQCTFTDAFAFLLTDADGNTTNLAIVPGTTDPISVLTVRDATYNGGCPSVNEEFFDKFYGPAGENPLISPTDFRGHTTILTAEATVVPNDQYSIKLVVADDGDTLFDSAVFLAAGSFDIGDIDLGDDILLTSGNANCEGDAILLDAGDLPNNSSIAWFSDGQLIDDATGTTLEVTTTALYRAEITINGTDCVFAYEILVEFFPNPEPSFADNSIIKCANEELLLTVDLDNADNTNLNTITYTWTLDGSEVQSSSDNTYLLSDTAEEQGVFEVTATDDVTGCSGTATVTITFYQNSYCVDEPQGLSPNGDGFNDCLILDHLEDREDIIKIDIFNRYGTKIYELNDYVDQWCGTDQDGKIVPVGTYFYIVYFNSGREASTSWIYINY